MDKDFVIEIGNGPEELARGKQLLADELRSAWAMMQQDAEISSCYITFKFGADIESWFKLSRNEATGEPQLGFADKRHRAPLASQREVAREFLTDEKNFYDIDDTNRWRYSNTGEPYPAFPRQRLQNEDPAYHINLQQQPKVLIDLEPVLSPREFGVFPSAKVESERENTPTPKAPNIK